MMLAGEALTDMPRAALDAMGAFYPSAQDVRTGKALIWGHLLYPLVDFTGDSPDAVITRCEAALSVLRTQEERLEYRYAAALFEIVREKARIARDLRTRYLAGDRAWLRTLAQTKIPYLLETYAGLMRLHRALWERDMRRSGWEVLAMRYGAVRGQLEDAADEILRYLSGELAVIEELEEAPLPTARETQHFEHLVTPSAELGRGYCIR